MAKRAAPSPQPWAYALPSISMAMLWTPLNVMQGIYVKYYGISLGLLAAILLGSRVYDAVADLLVGALSDWLKATSGRRKPLFALGGFLFGITGLLVYIPPQTVGPLYLTTCLFAFFTSYAMFMVPHLAWGSELASTSQQKTEFYGAMRAAGYTGLCLFYLVPLLPAFAGAEITPATIRASVILAVSLLAPALFICLRRVPEGQARGTQAPDKAVLSLSGLRALALNRPFTVLMGTYALCGLSLGIWYGMIFIFVDLYLARGALFAPLYLVAFGVGIGASLGWKMIARWLGKKLAWAIGMAVTLATFAATSALNSTNANAWSLGALLVFNTMGFASFELLPASILGDVADYSLLKSGRNQAATHFSAYMFLTKVLFALGGSIGLGVAAWLGFDPHAATQTRQGIFALQIVMSWLPCTLMVLGLMTLPHIPMDERRHEIVRRRLLARERREGHRMTTDGAESRTSVVAAAGPA